MTLEHSPDWEGRTADFFCVIDSPAIRKLLLRQLEAAISLYVQKLVVTGKTVAQNDSLTLEAIPLQQVEDDRWVLYKSAIALKLASFIQQNPLDIAIELAACFYKSEVLSETALEFTLEVLDSGWIYFQPSDRGLAVWLQYLIDTFSITPYTIPRNNTQNSLFPIQYAHARCCALLRLGEQQNLIRLKIGSQSLQLVEPSPIPWLNAEQELYLVHPGERRLIAQCLRVLDELSQPERKTSGKLMFKLAIDLSKTTLDFHSACRILGEVQREKPQLAQARLGLVDVARRLLRLMLEEAFSTVAPTQL